MSIKEGIEAMDAYFAGSKEEAFAKISNPYKKKRMEDSVNEIVLEETEDESDTCDSFEFNIDNDTEDNLE